MLFLFSRLGENLLFLFFGLLLVSLPFIIGGIVWWTLRKNKLNRAAWQQLSSEIGFHMPNPKHLEMLGNYNGIETKLRIGQRSHGSGEDRHVEYFTYCVSRFPKPLRFALKISSQKGFISNLFKGKHETLGHDSFDKKFGVECYDREVLRRLLLSEFPSQKTGNLMGDLMLASQSYGIITLTDEKVYVETSGHIRDHDELKHLLLVTNRLARRFAKARAKFPLMKWEKQLAANWSDFAKQYSLNADTDQITLEGAYNGFPLKAWVHSEPGKWKTSIEMAYPQKLMVGFQIYPEATLHTAIKLFGFQDLKAGHKAFDEAFIVKAKSVGVAKAKMTEDFCDRMVGLKRNASMVELTDEKMKITVEQVLGDQKMLSGFLNAVVETMDRLR